MALQYHLKIDSGDVAVYPESLRKEREVFAKNIAGTDPAGHVRNFFDCVKSRGLTNANADVMRHSHIACHAAAIAWMLKRELRFDPVTECFINDEEANRMKTRPMRAPWHI